MDAAYGPWNEIFSGFWQGYETKIFENPDRILLICIYEKEGEEIKGVLVQVNKVFVAVGSLARALENIVGYAQIIEKKEPLSLTKYFIINSGPVYVEYNMSALNDAIEKSINVCETSSKDLLRLSKLYKIDLVELKYAKEEEVKRLFVDPALFFALVSKKERIIEEVKPTKVIIGRKITGEKAMEEINSFMLCVVIGSQKDIKKMFHVLIENCVLSGKIAIFFDKGKDYASMNLPNPKFDFENYPDLSPVGLPLKNISLERIGVDLNLISNETLKEFLGLNSESVKKTWEMIDQALNKIKGGISSIEDIKTNLTFDTTTKTQYYQALRILSTLEQAYPDIFKGKMNVSEILPKYLTGGNAIRIEFLEKQEELLPLVFLSLLKTLYFYYVVDKSYTLKASVFIEKPIVSPEIQKNIEKEILKSMFDCQKVGVGVHIGTPHESDIAQEIMQNSTMILQFINENEAAAKEKNSKP
ncbi:MAG: hypothetical protein QW097_01750, partial [archaeon]